MGWLPSTVPDKDLIQTSPCGMAARDFRVCSGLFGKAVSDEVEALILASFVGGVAPAAIPSSSVFVKYAVGGNVRSVLYQRPYAAHAAGDPLPVAVLIPGNLGAAGAPPPPPLFATIAGPPVDPHPGAPGPGNPAGVHPATAALQHPPRVAFPGAPGPVFQKLRDFAMAFPNGRHYGEIVGKPNSIYAIHVDFPAPGVVVGGVGGLSFVGEYFYVGKTACGARGHPRGLFFNTAGAKNGRCCSDVVSAGSSVHMYQAFRGCIAGTASYKPKLVDHVLALAMQNMVPWTVFCLGAYETRLVVSYGGETQTIQSCSALESCFISMLDANVVCGSGGLNNVN